MADDATLPAAPADAGQPATQAVPAEQTASPAPVTSESAPAEQAATETPQATERLWAGKFKAPEVLEESYQHLQAESSRMAQRLAQYEKQAQPASTAPAAPPTYTPEQLETYKVALLQKQATAAATGDEGKAAEYAGNIVWIDRELRKQEINQYESRQTSQAAYQKLAAEVQPILTQYKDDLAPGTPVYNQAQAFYQDAVTVGAPANDVTATSAVLLALAKSGKFQQGTKLAASTQAVNTLNHALKTAAVAGGGGSQSGRSATPDIGSMTTQQFEAYRKTLGVTRP